MALGAGLLLAAHFSAWVPSLELTTVAASTVLCSTQPLLAAGLESRASASAPRAAFYVGSRWESWETSMVCYGDLTTPTRR